MKANYNNEQNYLYAKQRVEKIGKYYKHLAIYIAVNIFLSAIFIMGDINDGDTFKEALFNYHNYKIWIYWGIGILFQTLKTFGLPLFFNKRWEDKKIKQYLEEEQKRS